MALPCRAQEEETRDVFPVLLTFRVKLGVSGYLQHGLKLFELLCRRVPNTLDLFKVKASFLSFQYISQARSRVLKLSKSFSANL